MWQIHSRTRILGVLCATTVSLAVAEVLRADAQPPADSLWAQQWNMLNTGQSSGSPGADVGLLGAWGYSTGSSQIIVGLMRDAAYTPHPDFLPAVGGSRIVPDDDDAYDPHGTFIAGIIMAEANNGGEVKRGIAGIDQGCILWNYADRWS